MPNSTCTVVHWFLSERTIRLTRLLSFFPYPFRVLQSTSDPHPCRAAVSALLHLPILHARCARLLLSPIVSPTCCCRGAPAKDEAGRRLRGPGGHGLRHLWGARPREPATGRGETDRSEALPRAEARSLLASPSLGRLGGVHAGGSDVHPCTVCLQFKKLAISFSTMMLFTGITLLYGSSLQYAGMAPLDWGCVVVSFTCRASWQFPFQRIQCLVISPSLACTSSIYSCLNLS